MKNKLFSLLICSSFIIFFVACKKDTVNPETDLSVSQTVNSDAPTVGSNVTFTVSILNNGPSAATGVSVNYSLPAGYTLVSATPSMGTWGSSTWTVGNLANGSGATLMVISKVNSAGPYSNSATIMGSETDPTAGNNIAIKATVPVSPPSTDISATQTVSNSAPVVGTEVTFSVTVLNNGAIEATGVSVSDVLPVGYSLISASPSIGAWVAPNWTVGKMASGSSAKLTIVAKVLETGPYENTVSASVTEPDINAANNTATITTIPVPLVALKITFNNDVKPLLVVSCAPCHVSGGNYAKWDVYANAKSKITAIIDRVNRAQGSAGFMPSGGTKLSADKIAILNKWVTDGLLEK
jgi:uncharacterized repeat protein (TIGR01451 family)